MRVCGVRVRFFRSFNFDYERKAHSRSEALPWELVDDEWYPFISVPLDRTITSIVGANESGKSHLIDAIEQALSGTGISRGDFCRYSALYSVERNRVRMPDLGVELELQDDDAPVLAELGISGSPGTIVALIRFGDGRTSLITNKTEEHPLSEEQVTMLTARLPRAFVLPSNVPLPDSITIGEIIGRPATWDMGRSVRAGLRSIFEGISDATPEALSASLPQMVERLQPYDSDKIRAASVDLARRLLVEVARIDLSAFVDLERALDNEQEGEVGGIVESMNRALARHLNFSRWWRQDQQFQLRVSPRDNELVFTIRDRTGTDYSFGERSRGLRFFLGYYVQLLAHKRPEGVSQVLLIDEPDAYLSSVAQQDLLRVLEHFAAPEGRASDQVVYVTHSPFLVDKNAASRIRVLDKGSNEEGTRVVNDAVRNHYEPLRSSIGAFVAETAFLGGSNLIVEGAADQVLLSGINAHLRRRGTAPSRLLDLNDTTIVPAGSASQVPYMAYLARGRDELKPACVVLLDGDTAGRDARRKLMRSTDGRRARVIDEGYILDLGQLAATIDDTLPSDQDLEIEDLIPESIAVQAARGYATRLLGVSAEDAASLTQTMVTTARADSDGSGVWSALTSAFERAFDTGIDKLGFAKEVVRIIDAADNETKRPAGIKPLEQRFAALLETLSETLMRAQADETERRTVKRTDEVVKAFLLDHPESANRDTAAAVLREIFGSLESSIGDDAVARKLTAMRTRHKLDLDPLDLVPEFEDFAADLRGLKVLRRDAYKDATS